MRKTELATKEEVVWFEKTVEYKFIADCLERGIIKSIMPLSGYREQIGDAVTVLNEAFRNFNFYIIEFKKELDDAGFYQEVNKKFIKKLEGYKSAKTCFNKSNNHSSNKGHYFVGAKYQGGEFQLVARDYFAPSRKTIKTLSEVLTSENGMKQEEFSLYVRRFTSHKKTNKCYQCRDSGNGGTTVITPNGPNPNGIHGLDVEKDISVVVAINPSNKECITFPLTLVQLTDGLGGAQAIIISPDVGGGSGDGVVVNRQVIFYHAKYSDPELDEIPRPDDMQEEILG
ncbi:hypothetical protein L8T14_04970 [Enterobacter bugandensis]|uniref:hypothetical protein n=1 Tax=Enterobacter bugandensis TaxID=881260 RepID=UPI002002D4C3|nr:hypothetical protein [Enterobacter bugandensis]MCK6732600.1 hypothetical protein [Enterobacter bugandensis]HCM9224230.1 hypothetical protein [Enterobacter bugandensis]